MTTIAAFWADWQRVHTDLEPAVEWLGSVGWTIPMWAGTHVIDQLQRANIDVDAFFVRRYTSDKNAKLRIIWNEIRESNALKPWHLVLEQAVASYGDRRYAVVVPSLLLTFEGVIAAASSASKKQRSRPIDFARSKRQSTFAGMRRLTWASLESFARYLFVKAPFDQRRPLAINRHWVLHGREVSKWARRKECIRLFHALNTAQVTLDHPR